jgi:beta-glucosidase
VLRQPDIVADILRDEWGFDGYVVSDCWAIGDIWRHHGLAATVEQAAALAVRAGTDLNCGEAFLALLAAREAGLIGEAEIDRAVTRLMTARFRLGLLDEDSPAEDPELADSRDRSALARWRSIPFSVVNSPEHVALAREAAVKSIVLLKNGSMPGHGYLLPLNKEGLRSVALLGPAIDDELVLLGNYHGTPARPVTVLEGLRAALGDGVALQHGRGCQLAEGWPNLRPVPPRVLAPARGAPDGEGGGLTAAYFPNAAFDGNPALERADPGVDFVWREERPLPYMGRRPFSARWTGKLAPEVTGRHRLAFRGAGRFAVHLDGRLLLRGENPHHPMIRVADVDLEAGLSYGLRIEYQSALHHAHAQFLWATPGQAQVEREEALACAVAADVVIACLGLSPELEGEEMSVDATGFRGGDRMQIALPAPQQEFLEMLYGLGKPVVLVLLGGSAISIPWAAERLPAILQAWYPGEQGGAALADILLGAANPSGRLPVTVYRALEDLPPFEDYALEAAPLGRTYRYFRGEPLWAFGHGLSYTRFAYNRLRVEPETIPPDGAGRVSVEVSNVGEVAGDEVAQLYVSAAGEGRPRQELRGFARVHLQPARHAS